MTEKVNGNYCAIRNGIVAMGYHGDPSHGSHFTTSSITLHPQILNPEPLNPAEVPDQPPDVC